jgi:mono/diheme cytochrome c family protein
MLASPSVAGAAGETFGKDIAPILNRSCVSCHRPGEADPMSLIGYENVRPWVRSIRQKVTSRQMPPWSADPAHSIKFRNDPTLSQAEIDVIARWVDAGVPAGSDAAPAPPRLAEGGATRQGVSPITCLPYQPNGTAVNDRSSFGFWFSPTAPAAEIVKAPIKLAVRISAGRAPESACGLQDDCRRALRQLGELQDGGHAGRSGQRHVHADVAVRR